ncbi:MAG: phosphomannomutase/phosphoglucomutase [Myxococcota bacterium]|nr:phosphomannomutase/phosphoglucomutase [Myxococcota bacterium]
MSIFKAYDIRGIVPDELEPRAAYRVGRATARYLGAQRLGVGRDARTHSPEIADAVIRGISDEGSDVLDLGLVSTPMLYFGVEDRELDGGLMVTASHNPARYNGLKICREHAIPVGGASGLRDIEKLCGEVETAPAAARGGVETVDLAGAYAEHVRSVGGGCPALRVAIDCGNGMAGVGLEPLLATLPLEVERLYFEPDGRFPNHDADPLVDENLADLRAAVVRSGAQLGVAFDGDGDRAIFVDERGEIVRADRLTALLAGVQLRKRRGSTVLYDLRSSRATAEAIEAAGGRAEMCRVGHSFIKARMRESGAVFAGELSGHFYFRFRPTLVADDGVAALVALLDLLAEAGRPLSELIDPLRRYAHSGEINRQVGDVAGLLAALEADHPDAEVSHLDGLLVRYPDWWFNVRASNTEPVVRLNLEAPTEPEMRERRDQVLARIEQF